MTENAGEEIDALFAQIRLKLLVLRETDPVTTADLKSLLTQLEDWVEKLVLDSLKLQSLEKVSKKIMPKRLSGTARLLSRGTHGPKTTWGLCTNMERWLKRIRPRQ